MQLTNRYINKNLSPFVFYELFAMLNLPRYTVAIEIDSVQNSYVYKFFQFTYVSIEDTMVKKCVYINNFGFLITRV